jgi:hypothetical protein
MGVDIFISKGGKLRGSGEPVSLTYCYVGQSPNPKRYLYKEYGNINSLSN